MEEKWTTVIKPKTGALELNLKELVQYRDLIFLFVKRSFVAQYKQTILGPAWAVINPFLTTIVFTVIFGSIAQLPTDGVTPFMFYLCGNVAWGYFSGCFTATSNTFTGNAGIMGKVYFPRLVMPISTILTRLISFAIQFAFLIIFVILGIFVPEYQTQPNVYMLMIPLLVAQMGIMGLGFGIIVSALTTKYRDLSMLVSFFTSLWMYMTPVTYATSLVPEKWMWLYLLNPITPIIEIFRYSILGTGAVHWGYWGISLITTAVVVFVGIILFNRVEKTFMDTV